MAARFDVVMFCRVTSELREQIRALRGPDENDPDVMRRLLRLAVDVMSTQKREKSAPEKRGVSS